MCSSTIYSSTDRKGTYFTIYFAPGAGVLKVLTWEIRLSGDFIWEICVSFAYIKACNFSRVKKQRPCNSWQTNTNVEVFILSSSGRVTQAFKWFKSRPSLNYRHQFWSTLERKKELPEHLGFNFFNYFSCCHTHPSLLECEEASALIDVLHLFLSSLSSEEVPSSSWCGECRTLLWRWRLPNR